MYLASFFADSGTHEKNTNKAKTILLILCIPFVVWLRDSLTESELHDSLTESELMSESLKLYRIGSGFSQTITKTGFVFS